MSTYSGRWIASAALLFASLPVGQAQPRRQPPHPVVVLRIPGLTAADLTSPAARRLAALIGYSAVADLVCRAATADTVADSSTALALTAASGARAAGFGRRTPGWPEQSGAGIALARADSAWLSRQSAALDHRVDIGAAAAAFHATGGTTAVASDAATPSEAAAALFYAMDSAGHVDTAGPLRAVVPDRREPYGVAPDVPALVAFAGGTRATLAVVSCYALARARSTATDCTPDAADRHLGDALRAVDWLATGIAAACRRRGARLLIVSDSGVGGQMGLLIEPDVHPAGLAWSPTTRTSGLAANTDILPTLLGIAGIEPPEALAGRPVTARGPAVDAATFAAADARRTAVSRLQDAYGGLPSIQAIVAVGGILAAGSAAASAAAVIAALPLCLLLASFVGPIGLLGGGCIIAAWVVIVAATGRIRADWIVPRMLYATAALLIVDLLTGTHMLRGAWMSYSAAEGARFYGIGNEYTGVLAGAAMLASATLLQRSRARPHPALRPALLVSWAALVCVCAGSPWGAKVGSIPVLATAAVCSYGAARGTSVGWRHAGLIAVASVAGLALASAIDLARPARSQSHLARALAGHGAGTIVGIALRKIALEGWLLVHSPWTLAALVATVGLIHVTRAVPRLRPIVTAAITVATVAVLTSDSGISTAAEVLLVTWAYLRAAADAPGLLQARGSRPSESAPPGEPRPALP